MASCLRFIACCAVVVAVTTTTIYATPIKKNKTTAAALSASQFVGAVMREILPATAVDQIQEQARAIAFSLDGDAETYYRSTTSDVNEAASAAFLDWMQNSLQTGRSNLLKKQQQLNDNDPEYRSTSESYRAVAEGLAQIEDNITNLSRLKFTRSHVEFVAHFISSYFGAAETNKTASLNPNDILRAFRKALDEAKHQQQYRQSSSITAEVAAPAAAAATPTTAPGGLEKGADVVLDTSYDAVNSTMNILNTINEVPWPILMVLGVAFPPLNIIIHGIEAQTCYWNNMGALKFQSWAAWGPWLDCSVDLIKMLPLGPEIQIGLSVVIKLFASAFGYFGDSTAAGSTLANSTTVAPAIVRGKSYVYTANYHWLSNSIVQ